MAQTMRCSSRSAAAARKSEVAPTMRSIVAAPRPFCNQARSAALSQAALKPVAVRNITVRAATQPAAAPTPSKTGEQWYGLVANADFMFADPQNESLAEQLRERVRYFKEQNRETDFYIVCNPTWLDAKFPAQGKQVKRPCVALVSTDKHWITFMKLRLDRVLKFDLAELSKEEVLKAGAPIPKDSVKMPAKWTAPYGQYSSGWWEVFFPKH